MKKSHIALAIAALVPALAQAQSNVTMYGVAEVTVDVGYKREAATLVYNSAGALTSAIAETYKPGFRVQDGNSQGVGTSRWGVRGNEDLGGGMKANFQLEMGIRMDDGCVTTAGTPACSSGNSGGNVFGRNAWVGLSGGFGELRLGRQVLGSFGVQGSSWATGSSSGLYEPGASLLPLMGGVRFSNAIKYITPNLGGLTASVSLSAPEDQLSTQTATAINSRKQKTGFDLSVEYAGGPVYVGFGLNKTGLDTAPSATTSTARASTGYTFGAAYDLGVVKPYFNYSRQKDTSSGNTPFLTNATDTQKGWDIGIKAPFGAMTLIASYVKADASGSTAGFGSAAVNQARLSERKGYQIGAQYSLSNRTLLEANFGAQRVLNGTVNTTAATGAFAAAGGTGVREQGLNFGVRHAF